MSGVDSSTYADAVVGAVGDVDLLVVHGDVVGVLQLAGPVAAGAELAHVRVGRLVEHLA